MKNIKRITKAYAEYIATFRKSHWLVITTGGRLTRVRARMIMERLIEKFGIETYFWITEPYYNGGYHIHSCIDAKTSAKRLRIEIEKMTRGGRTEVEEWQHSKDFRGEQYITKLIDRECVDYDFGLDSKCHSKQQ
jgi:hypothetical protein